MRTRGYFQKAFSTLELLIAMALLVVVLSSVVLVSFGDQTLLAQGSAEDGALEHAERSLAQEETVAQEDLRSLNATTSVDGIYTTNVTIQDWPEDPYTKKRVTATVTWGVDAGPKHDIALTQLLTDYSDPTTLDTCDTALSGNWNDPTTANYVFAQEQLLPSFAASGHSFSTSDPIATLDAYKGMLYVGLASTSAATNDSFFAFDISDPAHPSYRGSIDNDAASTKGVAAIVAESTYVFGANSFGSNFKACAQAANCAQLQVFDVSDPSNIPAPVNFLLPTSSPAYITGSGGQASGNAIFYKDGYVYLGLQKTSTGPEFNIIDVDDPAHPLWRGGYQVGNTINQIYVRGRYAYLATDDKSREFIVLDVSDPTDPIFVGSFDPKNTLGYETGQSMYVRGDDAFVGMSYASGSPEMYDLDISDPADIIAKGAYTVGSTLAGLFARDDVVFALASTIGKLELLDVSEPDAIRQYAPARPLAGTSGAIDCQGNYFYIGTNAAQGNLTILTGS